MNRLHFYVKFMEERGVPPQDVLANTGLTVDVVSQDQFQPSPHQFSAAINNMLDIAGDGIGIDAGLGWNIGNYGMFGYALLSCNTMKDVLDVWRRFFPLTTSLLNYDHHPAGGNWVIELKEHFPLGRARAFAVEEYIARIIKTCPSIIGERDFGFRQIQLTGPAPSYKHLYEKHFGCEIKFGQRADRIVLDQKYLECKLSFANEGVSKTCEQHCMRLLRNISDQEKLPQKVRRQLLLHFNEHPSLEDVAKRLGLSARSFRRQLAEADTSFQHLRDEVRLDVAMEYLQNSNLTPKEISYRVGYSDVSNFRRAMKAWTGKKLSDFRKTAMGE